MNGILMALFGTLGTFLITALGAAGIFFVRREVSGNLQCGFLGFAGGVMIAASVWSLLLPGIDFAEANGQVGWLVMTGGFLLGVITLLVADGLMKAWYEREKSTQLTLGKSTAMLIIAITTHNIPEGMSVGLAFALAGQNMQDTALLSGAGALAIGIGIHCEYDSGCRTSFWCACSSICEICECIDCNITCVCCWNNDLCRCGRTDSTGSYGRKREDGHTRICCRFPCNDDIGCCTWIRKVLFRSECGKMEKGWGTKVMFTHLFGFMASGPEI